MHIEKARLRHTQSRFGVLAIVLERLDPGSIYPSRQLTALTTGIQITYLPSSERCLAALQRLLEAVGCLHGVYGLRLDFSQTGQFASRRSLVVNVNVRSNPATYIARLRAGRETRSFRAMFDLIHGSLQLCLREAVHQLFGLGRSSKAPSSIDVYLERYQRLVYEDGRCTRGILRVYQTHIDPSMTDCRLPSRPPRRSRSLSFLVP